MTIEQLEMELKYTYVALAHTRNRLDAATDLLMDIGCNATSLEQAQKWVRDFINVQWTG